MKIGLSYDVKQDPAAAALGSIAGNGPSRPDDWQEEFDSPATIEALTTALRGLGHEVVWLGDGRDFLLRVLADPPDLVFNLAEGEGISRCREARVPAVLEMLGIPHTGSDPLTLAATLDKDCARRLVATAGVLVPPGVAVSPGENPCQKVQEQDLVYPLIVKPAWEGSSKGIRRKCLVHEQQGLIEAVEYIHRDHCQPVLIEEFIQGEELTVGLLGNHPPRILGVMRVVPNQPTEHFVYSLEVKRDFERLVRYESPPQLPAEQLAAVEQAALAAWRVLGCRDVSRVDFRLRQGRPYFLEVNPLPGLNPHSSDLVLLARLRGWSYQQLIAAILEAALSRLVACPAPMSCA